VKNSYFETLKVVTPQFKICFLERLNGLKVLKQYPQSKAFSTLRGYLKVQNVLIILEGAAPPPIRVKIF